jgi:hypothetical protein
MFYFKRTIGLLVGTGLVCTFGTPAYGIDFHQDSQVEVQEFKTDSYAKVQEMPLVSQTQIVADRDTVVINDPSPNTQLANVSTHQIVNIPGNLGILGAARAQLGVWQDCTALVENSLRALGYSVGDLGPMGFSSYGVQVSPSDAQPGDIMMRGGHVAIYAGNGVAVHGGYQGSTLEVGGNISNPYNYSIIVRVN